MVAYFSPATVIASLLLLLAAVSTILAGLGGMDQPVLRDIPWLNGEVRVSFGNPNRRREVSNRFWLGLWNYCTSTTVGTATVSNCYPLVNGTDNQLLLFSGKSAPAEVSNIQVDGGISLAL